MSLLPLNHILSPAPPSKDGLNLRCKCTWKEERCRGVQAIMMAHKLAGEDEPRGGECIKLNLLGDSKKKTIWRSAVLSNLGLKYDDLDDLGFVPVARHHWSSEQLRFFDSGKRPSTPVSSRQLNDLTKRTITFDKRFKFEHRSGETRYFQCPNIPGSHFSNLHAASTTDERSTTRLENTKFVKLTSYSEYFHARTLESFIAAHEKENVPPRPRVITPDKPPNTGSNSATSKTLSQFKKRARQGLARARKKRANEEIRFSSEDLERIAEDFLDNNSASRYQLLSSRWHNNNPSAARDFFGFHSLEELKLYIQAYFSWVPVIIPEITFDDESRKLAYVPEPLSEFEQICVVKYFMHHCPTRKITGTVFGVHRTTILRYLNKWAPLWATFGEYLSILLPTF